MVKVIKSNILSVDSGVIGHQVNCKRVFGAGLAKQIRDRYPVVYGNYLRAPMKLGECQLVNVYYGLFVANLFGQDTYGRTGTHTNYKALGESLNVMFKLARLKNLDCHLPYKLGCGLAGGDWSVVLRIINQLAETNKVDVYIHQL